MCGPRVADPGQAGGVGTYRLSDPGDSPNAATHGTLGPVTELDYQEIIALSEDPDVSFDDVRGQPFTAERYAWLAEVADSVFYQCSLEVQVRSVIGMPVDVSARRLSRMSDDERTGILSQVPADLANEVVSQLPVGVS